jgi:hypothetical protein
VYDPEKEKPQPIAPRPAPTIPVPEIPQPVMIVPLAPPVQPKPEPETPKQAVAGKFFGTEVLFTATAPSAKQLPDISEKEVADYWKFLSAQNHSAWVEDVSRIVAELQLNDWGRFQLSNRLFEIYFPNGTDSEQAVFSVFLLNQMGYKAKIGRADGELVSMIAFRNSLSNTAYFPFNDAKYYVLNPKHKRLSSIQCCNTDYGNALQISDLSVATPPAFARQVDSKTLKFSNNTYIINYNKNFTDFYTSYPLVDFAIYADAPLEQTMLKSLQENLLPQIENKSQEEAVNFLLHFVQNAFEYKTDGDQYGYEKWNFAEETLPSAYTDCDDRAIFFAQLVKNLLGMKAVLLYYPGTHLATAVKFDNQQLGGSYVRVDNSNYLICDPTYINANLGMAIPQLRDIAIEIIRLK